MGRQPCCDKVGLKKGPWTAEEDKKLINFILSNGQCCWRAVPKLAGLLRCGKSCRLRWTNYLRPDLKRGLLSDLEEQLVIDLHAQLGNRWSKIASHMPGRTDNEIKNHWNTHIKKKLRKMGIDPLTHKPLSPAGNVDQTQKVNEIGTSPKSTTTSSSTELMNSIEKIISTLENDDEVMDVFCTDEVPMIEPHEIMVPNSSAPSSSMSSSSSSSSSASVDTLVEEYLNFPDLDWPDQYVSDNNLQPNLWNDDFLSSWDMLINDEEEQQDVDSDQINQYQKMVFDEESSWAFGLL